MEQIVHNPSKKCFLLEMDGAEAILQYQLLEQENSHIIVIDFNSTFVPPEFRGKGLAEKLVRMA